MNHLLWAVLLVCAAATPAAAQDAIYRCGNEYTNTPPDGRTKGCKRIDGGNVTVVQGTRVAKPQTKASGSANPSASASRIASPEQRSRDSDARLILQAELEKVQARQEELQKEYNYGQPVKRPDEATNPKKYLDRVAELKASLARNESDLAGLRREIDRLPPATAASVQR